MKKNGKPKLIDAITLTAERYKGDTVYILQCAEKEIIARLNKESYVALSKFDGKNSLSDAARQILEEFEAAEDQVLLDLEKLCSTLNSLRLLQNL